MQIKFANRGTTLIVSIAGELDHHSADYVRDKVDGELMKSSTRNIVFDFSKVTFMDSSGIGVIMGRYKNIQKLNGKASVINAGTHIKRIFEMSGMQKYIPMFDNLDKAMNF